MVVFIGGPGSIKGTPVSPFAVGQVLSIGSPVRAALARMAPFAIMLLVPRSSAPGVAAASC